MNTKKSRKNEKARQKRKVNFDLKMSGLADSAFIVLKTYTIPLMKPSISKFGISGKLLYNQLLTIFEQQEARVKEDLKNEHFKTLEAIIKDYQAGTPFDIQVDEDDSISQPDDSISQPDDSTNDSISQSDDSTNGSEIINDGHVIL